MSQPKDREAEYAPDVTHHYKVPAGLYALEVETAECAQQIQGATDDILRIISAPWDMQQLSSQRAEIYGRVTAATRNLERLVDLIGPAESACADGSFAATDARAGSSRDEIPDADFARIYENLVLLNVAFAHLDFAVFLAMKYDDSLAANMGTARRTIREVNRSIAAQATAVQVIASMLSRL